MKIELIQLLTEIVKQAISKKMTFKEAWLIFGATMYTGYRSCDFIPKNIPPWSKDHDLPNLELPPNDL